MYNLCLVIAILFILNSLSAQLITNSVKVKTSEGVVVGYRVKDEDYFSFYGVPYAGSSSGEYRFKEAAPPSKYEELIANQTDIFCAQPSPTGLIGVEDCLTLNIFTKTVANVAPVLVWLSGEDFATTNSTRKYSYKAFIQSDIVFVEVNYRLSIFGFLCLGVEDAPGNAGLKDIVQALKWIQSNIKAFGGNPKNIILFGHGSGAAMVDLVTLSNKADKLVHKAIVIGGTALSPWAIAYSPLDYAKSLSVNLGLRDVDENTIAKSLKSVLPETLVREINNFEFTNQTLLFSPCVENKNLKGPFLTDAPINLLKSKSYNPIPYIAGFVKNEGTMKIQEALNHSWLERMEKGFLNFLPGDLFFSDERTRNKTSNILRRSYFGNNSISNASLKDFIEYEGDSLIKYPILRNVKERAKASDNLVRLFTFDHPNAIQTYGNFTIQSVSHEGILSYIFDEFNTNDDNKLQAKKAFVERFTAFAKTGIPKNEASTWFPITATTFYYLDILLGDKTGYSDSIELGEIETKAPWNDIINSYYRIPPSVSFASNLLPYFMILVVCQMLIRMLK